MTESRRRTGRPPLTDRATLLAAARRIGFADLTVGAVTSEVGVKYSTFYRHFPSFEALVSEAVDAVLVESTFPEPGPPWQEFVAQTSATMFELLHDNPGLAQAIVSLPTRPQCMVQLFCRVTDVLLAAGFTPKDTALGATATFELALQPWIDSPGADTGKTTRIEQAQSTPAPLDDRVRKAIIDGVEDPPRQWVADKVELLIDGLEVRLAHAEGYTA